MSITAQDLVRREVYYCVSSLVHTLAKAAHGAIHNGRGTNPYLDESVSGVMHLADQAFELASPVLDYEEAAREAGWDLMHFGDETVIRRDDVECDTWRDACESDGIEPYDREVFEHWIVSDWLADKLIEKGEKVDKDFAGMIVWARTTTGQAVYMDHVIEQITADLNAEG